MQLNEAIDILRENGYILEDSGEVYPPNIAKKFKELTQKYVPELPLEVDKVSDEEALVEYKKKGEQVDLIVRNGKTNIRCLIHDGNIYFDADDIDEFEQKLKKYLGRTDNRKPIDYWTGNMSYSVADKFEAFVKEKFKNLFDEEENTIMMTKDEYKKAVEAYRNK